MATWIDSSPGAEAVPLDDRGFTLGDGVFDTALVLAGRVVAGDRHLGRLVGQAAAIGIAVDRARIEAGWAFVLGEEAGRDCVLRTTVTRGSAGRGLWPREPGRPRVAVTTAPWSRDLVGRPVRLATATIRRNEGSPASRLKSLGYLDNVLAAREAAGRGADDALMLNGRGAVAGSTIANLFVLRGGRLVTPPTEDGVLAGVTRGLLLEAAPEAGLEPVVAGLVPADLASADAVLLTNSLRLVLPVAALDGAALPAAGGPAVARLAAALAGRIRAISGVNLGLRDYPGPST